MTIIIESEIAKTKFEHNGTFQEAILFIRQKTELLKAVSIKIIVILIKEQNTTLFSYNQEGLVSLEMALSAAEHGFGL